MSAVCFGGFDQSVAIVGAPVTRCMLEYSNYCSYIVSQFLLFLHVYCIRSNDVGYLLERM